MKRKNIFHTLALAALALPMTISMGSCTEEDIIDNYGSVLIDSTYFMYDLNNLLEDMGGTGILHVYVYEVTNKHCLKHLFIQKQTGVVSMDLTGKNYPHTGKGTIAWTEWNLTGDTVIATNAGSYNYDEDRTHFCFGAGTFRTVAIANKTKVDDYTMNEPELTNILKYPSYENLRNSNFTYYSGSYSGEYYGERQVPWWGWTDRNVYKNANEEEAPYVHQTNGLAVGGMSYDTLKLGEHKTISLMPIKPQRDYTISVEIQKSDDLSGLVIKDGYGCISGIPLSVNFYYQTYDVENTAKIPFRFHLETEDNASNKTVKMNRTMGFTNVSFGTDTVATTATNGPGVLQMIIPVAWNSQNFNIEVLCNVSKSIINSGIIRKDEDGWRWGGSTTLPIKISTKITADMLEKARKGETIIWRD